MQTQTSANTTKRKTRLILAGAVAALLLALAAGGVLAQNRPADFPYTGVNYPAQLNPGAQADCQQFCKYAYACFYRGNEQMGRGGQAAGYHDQFMANCRRNVCGKPANRQKAITCYNQNVKGSFNQCSAGASCLAQGMR